MTQQVYWIWAQLALGIPCDSQSIFSCYPNARAIYEATPTHRRISGCFQKKQIERMDHTNLDSALEILRLCQGRGWSVVTPEDPDYPSALRNIGDYPLALYVWGTLPDLAGTLAIALVGARKCSSYGMRVADTFARRFAELQAVVVSGGALGVDAAAHKGAILAGGKTVAVLGCGLGTDYLRENSSLREVISKNGAVVAEYPPMTQASRYTFPVRNRLISGLCHGTVVLEAGLKSGSLITARLAGEQGREVFAVPGGVLSAAYEGTNRLLRDGVTPAFTPEEVLEQCTNAVGIALDVPAPEKRFRLKHVELDQIDEQAQRQGQAFQTLQRLSPACARVYHMLTFEPQYADTLAGLSAMTPGELLGVLTQLELAGLARRLPGKAYVLAE